MPLTKIKAAEINLLGCTSDTALSIFPYYHISAVESPLHTRAWHDDSRRFRIVRLVFSFVIIHLVTIASHYYTIVVLSDYRTIDCR